ncbi:MAG: metallophosphoesterase [Treponema sp.]|nr:metallophosphoesterase [Treponema sp.]
MEYVDFIVSALGKPTFFVFGNHNLEEFHFYEKNNDSMKEEQTQNVGHGADYVSGRVLRPRYLKFTNKEGKTTPLLIAGVSGSLRYNNGKCQYTESQMKRKLFKLLPQLLWNKIRYGRYLDILLTHASPRHIHDREDQCHKGFECFNTFMKKFKPALLVHGHIHLYDLQAQRVTEAGQTTVVNAYSRVIINMEADFNGKGENFVKNITVSTNR